MIASLVELRAIDCRAFMFVIVTQMLLLSGNARSGEVTTSNVTHNNGRFIVHSSILLNLPVAQVRTILTDHTNLPRINPNIQSVHVLEPTTDGVTRMRLVSQVCALLVCMDYSWVQTVATHPSGDIETRFDPNLSDFREGWVRYKLLPEGGNTRLITDAVLEPDFWFPPIIGSVLIKRKLDREALNTATGIEAISPPAVRIALSDN